MRTAETVAGLGAFARRGAGSDAERRAAVWLADELNGIGREAAVEPFWSRPNWALAHAWHVLLALAGSLLSVHHERLGGALILIALLSVLADALLGRSPGRRLTPERASQNVVASARGPARQAVEQHVRVVLTANYDAGRTGLAYRRPLRTTAAWFRCRSRGLTPGWLGWFVIALVWLEVIALVRLGGTPGTWVGVAQLIPTAALVVALAVLLDAGDAEFGPAAGDNASGVAVAIELARALDAAPPRRLTVDVVLEGAGDGSGIGLRRYLRSPRRTIDRRNTVVIGIGPCAAGRPRWWASDGALAPLRSFGQLRMLCETIARQDPTLELGAHKGRGNAPGIAARIRRIPTITIGCLDDRGLCPRSHQAADTPDMVAEHALDRGVELGLLLIDAIDAHVSRRSGTVVAPGPSPGGGGSS
jgi:hypothetical protein